MVEQATLVVSVSAGVSSEVAPLLVAHLVAGGPQSMIDTFMIQGKELIFSNHSCPLRIQTPPWKILNPPNHTPDTSEEAIYLHP